ncbi:acyltransferase family protein [Solwaraspora sp. WMMD406]|uniref:acyltransferase family protein n=1 Tax=Solwaraspora sp. WMMD406 TaxID=3016095 RepID=UPI002415C7E7|nr:acyltransferase family protein [Solwaraspora sp. WMMD406]MDG4762588.1 acyltransferase family protein [Solwaraspora sp. WMMD406]
MDVARGAAILLIVELHTQGALRLLGADHPLLSSVNVALATVRLPTFFLVSGLLAVSVLAVPWRQFLRRRPGSLLYLYLLWGGILLAVTTLLAVVTGEPAAVARATAHALLVADSELWYLVALAVFCTVSRLTRAVPVAVQLAAAAALAALAATDLLPITSWGVDHMLSCYLYFLIGRHFRPAVIAFSRGATIRRCVLLGVTWLVVGGLLRLADPSGRALLALLPLVALPLAVSLAAVAVDRPVGAPLRIIGRHTLPIYVLHPVVIAVLAWSAAPGPTTDHLSGGEPPPHADLPLADLPLAGQAGLVLVTTAGVAASCWLAWRLLRRIPGLFELPAPRVAVDQRGRT